MQKMILGTFANNKYWRQCWMKYYLLQLELSYYIFWILILPTITKFPAPVCFQVLTVLLLKHPSGAKLFNLDWLIIRDVVFCSSYWWWSVQRNSDFRFCSGQRFLPNSGTKAPPKHFGKLRCSSSQVFLR